MKKCPKTVDKRWSETLRMWKDICKTISLNQKDFENLCYDGRETLVIFLKYSWLIANNYDTNAILYGCFFCTVANLQMKKHSGMSDCFYCPARKIDDSFSCLDEPKFDFDPHGFYDRLVRLNKERKARKKRSK
jgi:hypothetical protein